MGPNETLFLDRTETLVKIDIDNSIFVQFEIWDFPGDVDFDDLLVDAESIFKNCSSLIYVIDALDNYYESLPHLNATILKAFIINPTVKFQVFIHKVDNLSYEQKIDTQREIQQHALEDLNESKLQNINLSFYLTSIYDHSVFEAFSKVVHRLIPELPTLENLLHVLIAACRMEKAFLIDVLSKIYVATDSGPFDIHTLERCSDIIDVVVDVSSIYGTKEHDETSPGFDQDPKTQAIITLDTGVVLYLQEVHRCLVLVCVVRQDKLERQGLIDYNFLTFRKALLQIFELSHKRDITNKPTNSQTGPTPIKQLSSG